MEPALCFELRKIVEALSESGKGLLAADESPSSLDERFRKLNLENTETTRRDFREMLFSADKVSFHFQNKHSLLVKLKLNSLIFYYLLQIINEF